MGDVVAQSIDIDAPIGEVWDLIMDPERLGEWVSIHRSVSDLPEGDLKKGSRFRQEMKLKGVPLKVKWEVVECRRPKHARWQGKAGCGSHRSHLLRPEHARRQDPLRLRERVRVARRQGRKARRARLQRHVGRPRGEAVTCPAEGVVGEWSQ